MKTPDDFAEAMKGRVSAQKRAKPANAWWPPVDTLDEAIKASDTGFWVAMIVAGMNALIATISVIQHTTIIGVDGSAYVDAALFAVIGWGIRRRARVSAVAGLLLFILEKVFQFITQPGSFMGWGVAVFLLLGFVGGVRGTFAYHRLSRG